MIKMQATKNKTIKQDDDGLFGSLQNAKQTVVELIGATKDEFDVHHCRDIILESCRGWRPSFYQKKRDEIIEDRCR